MMSDICGYIILRKPEFNFDKEGSGSFSKTTPKIGHLIYAGIDRMPWFELDEDYYGDGLPDEFIAFRKELIARNRDYTDFQVTRNFDKARKVLEYSNKDESINELAAIYSKKIERAKGSFKCDVDVDWLGVDIYCHGYGSIIREGIFKRPELFSPYRPELNESGLFKSESEYIEKYIQNYIGCAKENNLESIDGALKYLDHISIAKIMT